MKKSYFLLLLFLFSSISASEPEETIYGRWVFMPEQGTDIVTWRYRQQELEITKNQGEVAILHNFFYRREVAYVDSMIFKPGGETATSIQKTQNWAGNWYAGVLAQIGSEKKVSGEWQEEGRILKVEREEDVQTSQGEFHLKTSLEYRVIGDRLIVLEKRSTRPTPVILVFEKKA